jgi:hypothetical protein
VALAAPGHQHTRQDHAVPRSPPPITRPRGRQHSHRQANRPRTPTLHLDRDQPSLVPGRDHRLRPAVLATAALPAWNTGQRRTEDPALPALLHTAARIVRGQRKHTIRIPGTWPWASQLATCLRATFALPHQLDVDQHKPAPTTAPTPGPWNPALTQRDSRASNPNSTLTTTSTTIMKINIWEPEATPVNPRMIKASRRPRPEPPDSSSVYRTRVRHLNSTEAAVDRAHLPLTQQRPVATPPLRGALASCSTGRPIGSSWTP